METGIRERVWVFVQEMIREELDAVLARPRYGRRGQSAEGGTPAGSAGHRHGSRTRTLIGSQLVVVRSDAYHIAAANADECVADVLAFIKEARRKA